MHFPEYERLPCLPNKKSDDRLCSYRTLLVMFSQLKTWEQCAPRDISKKSYYLVKETRTPENSDLRDPVPRPGIPSFLITMSRMLMVLQKIGLANLQEWGCWSLAVRKIRLKSHVELHVRMADPNAQLYIYLQGSSYWWMLLIGNEIWT